MSWLQGSSSIRAADGEELLIHIGIDTVKLNGNFFKSCVKQEQSVKKGDLIGTFDLAGVKSAGYDPTVMMIVMNSADFASITSEKQELRHGEDFLTLQR